MNGKMKSMKEKETRRDERIRETGQAGIVSEARVPSLSRQTSTLDDDAQFSRARAAARGRSVYMMKLRYPKN